MIDELHDIKRLLLIFINFNKRSPYLVRAWFTFFKVFVISKRLFQFKSIRQKNLNPDSDF